MKLVIGLGNPGKKYQGTRHNAGFIMLDFIFDNWLKDEGFSDWKKDKKFQAEISEGTINNEKIILAKPQTFMNESGIAAQALLSYYKTDSTNLIVIQDELDLPFGNYKIQTNISGAGHNGIGSIIQHLGTQNFQRVRIGVGKTDRGSQGDVANFVLGKFNLLEKLKLKEVKRKILENIRETFTSSRTISAG
ncbi:MAG: aminoacyl-tRNA hydrolase [Parcubacteria group bacterium]